MEICIPIGDNIYLKASDKLQDRHEYATSSLPKGFLLVSNGLELAEEAVGFGFPVIMCGLQSLFPGQVEMDVKQHGSIWSVQTMHKLNLVEKIHRSEAGSVESRLVYAAKDTFAYLIRKFPPLRRTLTAASSGLRRTFSWKTTYKPAGVQARIKIIHTIHEKTGKVTAEVHLIEIPSCATEAIVMNEQGATYFDLYQDTNGLSLKGERIGCWDQVIASGACFSSLNQNISFKLDQAKGARLYRGRELVGSRLVWAGFGYSFLPSMKEFHYELEITRLQ